MELKQAMEVISEIWKVVRETFDSITPVQSLVLIAAYLAGFVTRIKK
jgi:hypothetical protein